MGIYACEKCFQEYDLVSAGFSCRGSCEICGPLRKDWESQFVTWTPDINRQIPEDKLYLLRRLKELTDGKVKKTL